MSLPSLAFPRNLRKRAVSWDLASDVRSFHGKMIWAEIVVLVPSSRFISRHTMRPLTMSA